MEDLGYLGSEEYYADERKMAREKRCVALCAPSLPRGLHKKMNQRVPKKLLCAFPWPPDLHLLPAHLRVRAATRVQLMHFRTTLCVTILPGAVHAFSGGWNWFAHSTRQHRQHPSAGVGSFRNFDASSASVPAAPKQQLRLMPNEYEAFFNKASKLGADATRNLAPEERAQRAMEAS